MSDLVRRPRSWRLGVAIAVLGGVFLLIGQPVPGLIHHSITVDGDVADWGDVLTDPENTVADAGSFSDPVDPDVPGTADRDLRGVAFTWDSTYLYFFFRRTLSGNNSFTFLAYIDLGHDGSLNATDDIVRLDYNGAAFQTAQINRYSPFNAAGDAITGDGVDEPGGLGALVPGTPDSADSPDGIEFEARVPWTALGVPAGTCVFIHPSIARGTNLPSQVEDNTNPLDTQDAALRLESDRAGGSASPGTIDYAHRACNDGNCADTFDLTVRSPDGWRVDIYSDPNGDGSPADGTLLGIDANGDGDYSDPTFGDQVTSGADSNGNNIVDSGSVAAGGCFNYVVRAHVPSGVPAGTVDVARVRARSTTRPTELKQDLDVTTVGPIVVYQDTAATGVAGDDVWIAHRACNEQAFADTLNLTSASSLGWATQVWSDPNGDGDPSDGAPITSVGPLAAGACTNLLLRVSIPTTATAGTVATATLTATSAASPGISDSVLDTITVAAARFSLTPNHVRDAGPFNTLFLPHVIQNDQAADDNFTLTIPSFPAGWTVTLLTDPDGDGEPDDSTTITIGSNVGPVQGNGGRYHFILRVDIPQTATIGSVNTITILARSVRDTTKTATAIDTITIKRVLTYSDPLFARPSATFFVTCGRVYVQAHGLVSNRDYRFIWTDPAGAGQRTSPTYQADARGRVDDSFAIPCGLTPGTWRIDLQIRSGSSWSNVDFANFTTLDPAASSGTITRLEMDQPVYNVTGDLLNVQSTLTNGTAADYIGTAVDYVVFRDANGDGVPTAGEDYIRSDGTRTAWAAGNFSHRTTDITVYSGFTYEDYWYIPNAQFGVQGTWCTYERWYEPCTSGSCTDVTIDTELTCFLVSCLPAPLVDAGANKSTCAGVAVALSDSSSTADTFLWSDGGAGGAFSPSSTVLHPSYTRATSGTVTLTLTGTITATGCSASDTLTVTINANPVVDAGANKTTCAGVAVALSDSSGGIADTFAWSDGGAGGTFTPSATVLHPSYANATAGTYTLTLAGSVAATGCAASDTLSVTVNPNPVVDAGANKATCASVAVALSDSAGGTATSFAWSDGGAGGTFTPSATVLHPSYSNAAAGTYTLTFTGTVAATGCAASDTLSVTVNPNPAVDAGANKATCAGTAVTLSDATGGIATSFAWSDGGFGGTFAPSATVLNPSYTNTTAGTYTLTLTGTVAATGCAASDTLTVTVNPNPIVDAGANKTACAGVAVALADSGGGIATSFAWGDGGAGGTFTPSATVLHPSYSNATAGTYTITLTGTVAATGCAASDTLTVTVNPNPVVNAGTDKTTCAGTAVALSDATGGIATTFAWSDAGAGGTFTPSATALNPSYTNAAGTYTLTLTGTVAATGCASSDTLAVTVNANPAVDAGTNKTTCAGTAVALSDAAGGIATTFAWSDGGAGGTFTPSANVLNPSYANAAPGTYTLTLTGTVGTTSCAASDTLTVTVSANPVVDAGANKATCAGVAVSLADATGGAATAFSWSDGGAGGTFAPSASVLNPSYSNATAGTYTLTLTGTVGATTCSGSDTLTVTVNPNPVVNAGADKSTCAGVAVSLPDSSGGVATAFAWSDGGAGGTFLPSSATLHPTYSNATAGTYTLTLTGTVASTGCTSSDTLTVTVNPRPSVDAGADKLGCSGTANPLTDATSDGATFAWSDGGAGGTFSPSATVLHPSWTHVGAGTFTLTLTATSSAGCTASDTLTVTIQPLPVAAFTVPAGTHCEDTPVCFTNTSTSATSYFWQFGDPDANTSTDVSPCFTYAQAGTYTVRLTATNSCGSNSTTRTITISPLPVADFSFATQGNRFCKNKNVTFTDLSTNTPTSWQWDFGDGATSTLQNPVHAYLTDGLFIVSLVACNACGCSAPHFEAVSIAATCNTNCEANSNQIDCSGPPTTVTGDTCTNHDNFNTTSYPCAPGFIYSGENRIYDLNFLAGSNFVITLTETVAEPNGYDLDLMVSDACNPPECVAWGDTQVTYDDRTAGMDDFFLIVDGRNGTCGPFTLTVNCIDPTESAACTAPTFAGIAEAHDPDPCRISGIAVSWPPVASWGTGTGGTPCATGIFEIWRAPSSDLTAEIRIGTAPSTATSFLDLSPIPGVDYTYRVHAVNTCCGEPRITTATASATDLFNGQPVAANAGADRTLTCASPSATLLGSGSGGSGAGFDYSWSPTTGLSNPLIPNPTVSQPGTYTLTVTDRGNGCTATDTVEVTGAVPPTVSAGPDRDLTCSAPLATLQGSATGGDGSGGRTFAWTPSGPLDNATLQTPHTSTPGTYTLTVTDTATGCSSTDTVTVVDDRAPPVASAGPDRVITCAAPSAPLAGSASGGDGRSGYSYSWAPAAGLDNPAAQQPNASAAGTWTLTVTDVYTGCTGTDTVTVVADMAAPVAAAGPDRVITCTTTTVTLAGSGSGGNGSLGYSFHWEPAAQVSNADVAGPTTSVVGTYTLTVTDRANGCTGTDTVVVSLDPLVPTASAGPDRELTCLVASVILQGAASGGDASAGYSYHWEPAGSVSNANVAQPTTSAAGAYTLTVTTLANGCTAQDVVVVADDTAPPVASAGADKSLSCASPSVVLDGVASGGDGSAGYSYSWSPATGLSSTTVATPTATRAGTFTLTVTDVHTGCTSADSVVIGQDFRAPSATAGPDRHLDCTTTSAILAGGGSGGNGSLGYSYAWSPGTGLSSTTIAQPTATQSGTFTLTVTDLANGCTATDTVVVTQDVAAPTATAGPDRRLDCTTTSAVLAGAASGGNGSLGYSYAWSPATGLSGTSVAQPTATQAGTFTLTVTDLANGCTSTDTVVVTQDVAAPIANAGPDRTVTCTVGTVTLQGAASGGNGSLGYDFSWAPAAQVSNPSLAQPTTSTPGLYTLTVTDRANGCTDTDTVFVNDDRIAPVADAGPDRTINCTSGTVTLSGTASGGDGSLGYAFHWEPAGSVSNANIATPTTSVPGTYTLTVTDIANGCTSTDTAVVAGGGAGLTASAGPDAIIDCATSTVTLQGSASGGDGSAGYSYAWSPPGRVSNPSIATPTTTQQGTYTLTVTDVATGCTATDTVTVTRDRQAPTADAGPNRLIGCGATSTVLAGAASGGNGSAGYSFAWTPVAGLSDPAIAQPTATVAATYTLTVTDLANHCTATDTVVVTIDQRVPTASAGADKVIDCDTPSVVLNGAASGGNGSAGYSFAWSPAAGLSSTTIAQPTATAAGTYTLTVTDLANNCTASDSVTVTVDTRAPVANAGPDAILDCRVGSVTLTGSATGGNGTAGYAFHWEPAGAVTSPDTATTQSTAAGTYTLTVTDLANGCTSTDTAVVTTSAAPPAADAGADSQITCTSRSASLSGAASGGDGSLGYGASWSPTAGVADPTSLVTTTTRPGTYTLTVTDVATGCRAVDTVTIADDTTPPTVGAGADLQVDCDTPVVMLQGSASGGDGSSGYQYLWSPATGLSDATSQAPTTTQAGTWTLTVTDVASGCTATDSVTVTLDLRAPVVSAGADKVVDCASSTVILDGTASGGSGAGFGYRWSPAAGLSDPAVATPTASQARTYTLTITDLGNGCTATDTVTVTTDMRAPTANAGADTALTCASPTATLTGAASGGNGSAGYSFHWEPASGVVSPDTQVTQAFAATTYTLTVIDLANGCTATDTVVVSPAAGAPTANAGTDQQQTCAVPQVTLSGSASGGDGSMGYTYHWEPAGSVATPDAATTTTSVAGTYTLTVTDVATGCTAVDAVDVLPSPGPTADAGADQQVSCVSPTRTIAGTASGGDGSLGYTFHWEPAADVASPDTATTTTALPGTYTLTVTDLATGCTAVDTVTVAQVAAPAFPEPSALDVRPAATPLRVAWLDPSARTTLVVTFEDVAAFEYRLYQGTIGNFPPPRGPASYDHARAACGLVSPSAAIARPTGNVYFLAVSANCDGTESSYGRSSLGVERPDAATASGSPCP